MRPSCFCDKSSRTLLFIFFIGVFLFACDNGHRSPSIKIYSGRVINGFPADSNIAIYAYSTIESDPIYVTRSSAGESLDKIGCFNIPSDLIEDSELYLVIVSGGVYWDVNGDGIKDASPTPSNSILHAVLTPTQLKNGDFKISFLTEAIYQRLRYLLSAQYPVSSVVNEMNFRSGIVLSEDVDGDNDLDSDDVACWNPNEHMNALRQNASAWQPLIDQIFNGENPYKTSRTLTNHFLGSMLDNPQSYFSHIKAQGDSLFVSDNNAIYILNAGNSPPHVPIARIDVAQNINDMEVVEDLVFIATGSEEKYGMMVIDVSRPENPAVIGVVETPAWGFHIGISGNFAFLVDKQYALWTIDISDPANPVVIGQPLPFESISDLKTSGRTVFLVTTYGTIQTIDFTNPQHPKILDSVSVEDALYVELYNERAYVYGYETGLIVIDISDPGDLRLIGAWNHEWVNGSKLTICGNRMVIENYISLSVFEITGSMQAIWRGTIDISPCDIGFKQTTIHNDIIYVLGMNKLCAFRADNAMNNPIIGSEPTRGATAVVGKENVSYVAYDYHLQSIDVTDPSKPTVISASDNVYAHCHPFSNMTVENSVAYVNRKFVWVGSSCLYTHGGISLFAIQDSQHLEFMSEYVPVTDDLWEGYPSANTAVNDNLIFTVFSDHPARLLIVAPGMQAHPGQEIASLEIPDIIRNIQADNDLVYIAADTAGLQIADVSIPEAPIALASVDITGSAYDIEIENSFAYVLSHDDNGRFSFLTIIDIVSVSDPIVLNSYQLPNLAEPNNCPQKTGGMKIYNQFAYIYGYANGPNDILVIDTRDPDQPEPVGIIDIVGCIADIDAINGIIHVAGSAGLQLIRSLKNPVP